MMEESSLAVSLCEEKAWLPPLNVSTVTYMQTALREEQLITEYLQCTPWNAEQPLRATEFMFVYICEFEGF